MTRWLPIIGTALCLLAVLRPSLLLLISDKSFNINLARETRVILVSSRLPILIIRRLSQ